MPVVTSLLRRVGTSSMTIDRRVTEAGGILGAAGALITGLAPSRPVLILGTILYSMGSVALISGRSLITSLVPKDHVATTYSAIAVMTATALLTGGPLYASLFQWGSVLGRSWIGMPFLAATILYAAGFVAALCLKLPAETDDRHEDGDRGGSDSGVERG